MASPVMRFSWRTGIKKLRAVYVIKAKHEATKTVRLWRGMRNLDIGDKFLANNAGGTEVAPMSTTTDMRVAVRYGLSYGSLLFLLKVDNFLQYGAELGWLSAFPGEAEVKHSRATVELAMTFSRGSDQGPADIQPRPAGFACPPCERSKTRCRSASLP